MASDQRGSTFGINKRDHVVRTSLQPPRDDESRGRSHFTVI